MSKRDLLLFLVQKYIGRQAQKIIQIMFDQGNLTLSQIFSSADLELEELRQLLILLVKKGAILIKFLDSVREKKPVYSINYEGIYQLNFTEKYLIFFKSLHGILGKNIIESFILEGKLTIESCVAKVTDYIEATKEAKM